MGRRKGDQHKHNCKEKEIPHNAVYSDSEPELSSSELDSDECSLS
jgi:hypothetical protein